MSAADENNVCAFRALRAEKDAVTMTALSNTLLLHAHCVLRCARRLDAHMLM